MRLFGGAGEPWRLHRRRGGVFDEPRHEVLQRVAAPPRDSTEDGAREQIAGGDDPAPDAREGGRRVEGAHADAGRDASRSPAESTHDPAEEASSEPAQLLLDPDRRVSV